jgi:hypothetical protein
VQNADVIFVIGEGKVVETGNHTSLLRKRGIYYQMVSFLPVHPLFGCTLTTLIVSIASSRQVEQLKILDWVTFHLYILSAIPFMSNEIDLGQIFRIQLLYRPYLSTRSLRSSKFSLLRYWTLGSKRCVARDIYLKFEF